MTITKWIKIGLNQPQLTIYNNRTNQLTLFVYQTELIETYCYTWNQVRVFGLATQVILDD